jgi:AraC family transcriptional regulator of adaptative response / DNA-3-methyladenine glycosylase II
LEREALPGVEVAGCGGYRRTVRIDGRAGVVLVEDAASRAHESQRGVKSHLTIDMSPSLLPVLMPLLVRLRCLFDLDAEPAAIDAHLSQGGLADLVGGRPGLRVPGTLDGFELVLRTMLGDAARSRDHGRVVARRVVESIADPIAGGFPGLTHLAPTAEQVAQAGADHLAALGVPRRRAGTLAAIAHAIVDRKLQLEPGSDVDETRRALMHIGGVSERVATTIIMRSLYWPDALPLTDTRLQRAVGVASPAELRSVAESWRPWRSYAAQHLWLGVAGEFA